MAFFAVAMTLLVLDVRLPEDFHPHDGPSFSKAGGLWPKFLPYRLSFGVLGLRWLANLEIRTSAESVNREYANWWLFYLLLITCVRFFDHRGRAVRHLAPAVWRYAGHLLIALVGGPISSITPHLERDEHLRLRQLSAFF